MMRCSQHARFLSRVGYTCELADGMQSGFRPPSAMAGDLQTVHMSDVCAIKAKILGDEPDKPLMITIHGAPRLSTHVEPEASGVR